MRRPSTLVEVAAEATDRKTLGYAIVEFLDEFDLKKNARMLAPEPPLLRDKLDDGGLADAYLAAVAVHLSYQVAEPPPSWTRGKERFLRRPWFASPGASLRATLLLESPAAFRERNLFVSANALERA